MASHLKPQLNITLYRGFQGSGIYVWSPFVNKLEARLRFAGLSYRTEAGSLSQAPRGKIPYVALAKTDSDNPTSTVLGDSTLIIEKLIKDDAVADLNVKLSPAEKAHDLALRALLEDKLYFYQVGCVFVPNASLVPDRLPRLRHLPSGHKRLTKSSTTSLELRTMARELLHHATARARRAALPRPAGRRPACLPQSQPDSARSGHHAVLGPRDRLVSAADLGERQRASRRVEEEEEHDRGRRRRRDLLGLGR